VAGQALVSIEAMKMETVLTAPSDGIVHRVLPVAGSQVVAGEPLVILEAAEVNEKDLVLEGSAA
jgi:urea carboxylase